MAKHRSNASRSVVLYPLVQGEIAAENWQRSRHIWHCLSYQSELQGSASLSGHGDFIEDRKMSKCRHITLSDLLNFKSWLISSAPATWVDLSENRECLWPKSTVWVGWRMRNLEMSGDRVFDALHQLESSTKHRETSSKRYCTQGPVPLTGIFWRLTTCSE